MASCRASEKSQAVGDSLSRPPPSTSSLMPADRASLSAEFCGSGLATATRAAADAGKEVACRSACRGDTSSLPASTKTRIRETVHGSCNEERTSGKGSETPSSGSMSHAPSAPSTSMGPAPGARCTSSPTTTGSSLCSRRTSNTCGRLPAATTRTMPSPQLKVEAISQDRIFPMAAIQRRTAGNSQASARRRAASCGGSTSLKQRERPPLATGAAPRSSPSLASARSGLT
mmetsp:Transcript_45988/g.137445  ORF Transcript_45988/g.137445 Transcript_45988/m.137445 type:complete len:230 (-) Transcript_45988:325-1014(-)